MLQNIIQMYNTNQSIKVTFKSNLAIFLNLFRNIKFADPLYYLTVPGLVLNIGGIYTGLNLIQAYFLEGNFDFGFSFFTVLLTFIGMCLAFAGILVHSITGFMKYAENKL